MGIVVEPTSSEPLQDSAFDESSGGVFAERRQREWGWRRTQIDQVRTRQTKVKCRETKRARINDVVEKRVVAESASRRCVHRYIDDRPHRPE